MKREARWAAIAEASSALQAALTEWQRDGAAANRAKVETLSRDFIDRLAPVLGHEAAFRFEASWQAFIDAVERHEQLTATMAGQPTIDTADADLLRHLHRDVDDALRVFERVEGSTQAALADALARDSGGGD